MLASLSFLLSFKQFARADIERFAEGFEGVEFDALRAPARLDEPVRLHLRDASLACHGQLIGGGEATLGHQFGESESHVEHATNVTNSGAIIKNVANGCDANGTDISFGVPSEDGS